MSLTIYIDTEFTSFFDPRLISIGAVTDHDESFYGIVDDFPKSACTHFVHDNVLPLLDAQPANARLGLNALARRFCEWLHERLNSEHGSPPLLLMVDDESDRELTQQLLEKGGWVHGPETWVHFSLHPMGLQEKALERFNQWFDDHPERRMHNALDDAEAYRWAICGSLDRGGSGLLRFR